MGADGETLWELLGESGLCLRVFPPDGTGLGVVYPSIVVDGVPQSVQMAKLKIP